MGDKILVDRDLMLDIYDLLEDADATFKLNGYMEWEQTRIIDDNLKDKVKKLISK